MLQLLRKYYSTTYSFTYPPLSNLQLSELRQSGVNKIAQALKWQMDSKLGSLDWESNVLTVCHSAPCNNAKMQKKIIHEKWTAVVISHIFYRGYSVFTAEHKVLYLNFQKIWYVCIYSFINLQKKKSQYNKHPACFPLHNAQNSQVL